MKSRLCLFTIVGFVFLNTFAYASNSQCEFKAEKIVMAIQLNQHLGYPPKELDNYTSGKIINGLKVISVSEKLTFFNYSYEIELSNEATYNIKLSSDCSTLLELELYNWGRNDAASSLDPSGSEENLALLTAMDIVAIVVAVLDDKPIETYLDASMGMVIENSPGSFIVNAGPSYNQIGLMDLVRNIDYKIQFSSNIDLRVFRIEKQGIIYGKRN